MKHEIEKVALVGLRASGKSTVGAALAKRLGWSHHDLDDAIVAEANVPGLDSCREVLLVLGEPAFRAVESKALRTLLAQPGPFVLATGGGAIEASENRALLALHTTVVWLRVAIPILQARLRAEVGTRPPLLGKSVIDEVPLIAARRTPLYAEAADLNLDASLGDPEDLAEQIAGYLAGRNRPGKPEFG